MPALVSSLRSVLEGVVVEARGVVEGAALAGLRRLAVDVGAPFGSLSEGERGLRRVLRAKGRQLGDPLEKACDGELSMPGLVRECAYERWHQMLFAVFLAENELLMYPGSRVAVSLGECEELASELGLSDGWAVAARFAGEMLPGIFSPDDPLLRVEFAPEDRKALEDLIERIPKPVFVSEDGLGWVYQFWQTQRKKEVSGKVSGTDIAPVTQLFTEHYMVQFLLHNTLGAWWVARHPDQPLPTSERYLRVLEDGSAAAGSFDGWPDRARDLTVMDPCCGSGHFLVAAFALLKRFRMFEEGLSDAEAGDAVLRDNLFGLELDARCTQLAAFNVALEAWKSGGYRKLPEMQIACSGIPVGGSREAWTDLAGGDHRAQKALGRLYDLFQDAPDLGSLIDPNRLAEDDPLYTADYSEVADLVEQALAKSDAGEDPVAAVFGEAAQGLAKAAGLLAGKYWLVVTNVPYLTSGKQGEVLQDFIERVYPLGKADLATAFVERCRDFTLKGGSYALVTPQNWLFLGSYNKLRVNLLTRQCWELIARLGVGAFQTISGEVVNVALLVIANHQPVPEHEVAMLHATDQKHIEQKAKQLGGGRVTRMAQHSLTQERDAVIPVSAPNGVEALGERVRSIHGLTTGDKPRMVVAFWEFGAIPIHWASLQSGISVDDAYSGRSNLLRWHNGTGPIDVLPGARKDGGAAWACSGVVVNQMHNLRCGIYTGEIFDNTVAALIPNEQADLVPLWCFCSSPEFKSSVRAINQKVNVDSGYFEKISFDLSYWQKVAAEEYPDGLPEPFSDDPSQWLFNGSIAESTEPLQVGVARLVGFEWPEQGKSTEAHPFPELENDLSALIDEDGLVCLSAVAGERPAAERLRSLLAAAYGDAWCEAKEQELLAEVGFDGKSLEEWLWGGFFKQHVKVFQNRPFVWHVTDGLKDGFSALVNYHGLDRVKLERLIFTYLGSYLDGVREEVRGEVRGADSRLVAAEELQRKLKLILKGEPPFDVFVRWKSLSEQSLGWDPDLNDGVRLNVRPWVEAGVLRSRFNVKWGKDRGKDPAPNVSGSVERHNDLHFTLAEKIAARETEPKGEEA